MITISEIVVIGLLEVFAVLLLAVGLLLFLNHNLHKRGKSLSTQLTQLKETTKFLLDKVNEHGKQTYSFFLGKAVEQARAETEELLNCTDPQFSSEQTEIEKASLMRYLLLEAELAAECEEDAERKAEARSSRLTALVHDLEATNPLLKAPSEGSIELDEADLKQKWGYLCEAAIDLVVNRSAQSAEDLVDIIKVINSDLSLADIIMPEREFNTSDSVIHIKSETDRSREVIAKLLSERNAAEAEISVKATELERLQRFLNESEVVITQLESDYHAAEEALQKLKESSSGGEDVAEMKQLIERFTRESSEMLICIDTLEQENSELKAQLGLQ
ncbi:MAG: hypothetical protein ACE37D_08185 [Pseudomonadales bacterium]